MAVPGACDGTIRRDLEVSVHMLQAFIAIVPGDAITIVHFHPDVTILVIGASASIALDSGESGERLGTISSLADTAHSVGIGIFRPTGYAAVGSLVHYVSCRTGVAVRFAVVATLTFEPAAVRYNEASVNASVREFVAVQLISRNVCLPVCISAVTVVRLIAFATAAGNPVSWPE